MCINKIFKAATILFLLSIVGMNALSAQWIWQNPKPQGNFLYDVKFLSKDNGIICGDAGTILRTTNGGTNWIYEPTYYPDVITCLNYFDESNVIAAGTDWNLNGVIYRSSNGGLNFSRNIIPTRSFLSMFFLNQEIGWLGARTGKIFKTTNAGYNWIEYNTPAMSDINGIYFLDTNTGYAVSFDGYLLKTTNGGIKWFEYKKITQNYYSLYFYDNENGFATGGSNGLLQLTKDGGVTWQDISDPGFFGSYIFDVKFINTNTGWLSTGDYTVPKGIFKTTNGGYNWICLDIYLKGQESLTKLCLSDSTNIFCVGDYGTILKSTNKGINWNYQSEGDLRWVSKIQFLDAYTGYGITNFYNNSVIIRSTNGGNKWDSLTHFSNIGGLMSLNFINNQTGFAGGFYGRIFRTSNAGNNWTNIESGTSQNITDIMMINNNIGWLGGSDGSILRTTNSGLNWNSIANLGYNINGIYFINEFTGWACGDIDSIHKTINGGQNWSSHYFGDTLFTNDVFFVNNETGWITGIGGRIFFTSNGGMNWIRQYSGTNANLLELKFLNSNTGYICGEYNTILKTSNGGLNWNKLPIPNVAPFYLFLSIDFLNENTGWVSGAVGIILKTTNAGSTYISSFQNEIPENFCLYQNYPNPFNSNTLIKFAIKKSSRKINKVVLKIFDITGKEINTLINNYLPVGIYEINFNASGLSSGIYFCSLYYEGTVISKKILLLK